MKSLKKSKTLYSLYKAFCIYRRGLAYIYYRYFIAPKILHVGKVLERPVTHDSFSIHMLTSHQDILIAMWSLASFYATSGVIGHVTIHDDGTLQKEDIETIHRLFPSARIARTIDFLEQHGQMLAEYQSLLDFRRLYKRFQSKKLIDVYFERKGDIILYLDSDLLWFNASPEITEFVEKEMEGESFMMSNGVERVHVTFRDGSRTTDEVAECNSGVTLFNAKDYSLERLTEYINKCDYLGMKFTDQACFGTVLKNVHILPRDRYFIKGKIVEDTIMRHYTGPSREKFFFYGINFLASKILDTDTK